jgi:MoaA/NifB/PqqE/SkfB family radical SAM enzyme
VDGPEQLNDSLRFAGSYSGARATVRGLVALGRAHPRLEVVAHSVLSRRNAAALPALLERVAGWGVHGHSVELIRDPSLLPQPGAVRRLHRLALRNRARYLTSPLERVAILGSLALAQRAKERSLAGHDAFRCVAGRRVGVLDADGGLRPCELLPTVGNVREFGCDLSAAWQALAPRIPDRCAGCTHVCFINASLAADPRSLLRIPAAYVTEVLLGR